MTDPIHAKRPKPVPSINSGEVLSKVEGSKTQNFPLLLLLTLYLLLAFAHATLAPLTTGPDELAHYEYVRFIAAQGRLPLTYAERDQASYKSDQPPLYHLLAAIPTSWVDPTGPPTLKRVGDHPRRQLIERTRHFWGLYNTEDERWPFQAEILRWHVGRWVAILFGAATVLVTYFIAHEVFKQLPITTQSDPLLIQNRKSKIVNPKSSALLAATLVAFTPRFALTGSMLNYETTLAFFATLFLWILLRIAKGAEEQGNTSYLLHPTHYALRTTHYASRFTFYALLLGLFAGLAITAKLSAIILPLEIVIGLWLIKRYQGWTWRQWAQGVVLAALGTLLAVSWWFGFILYQFNTIATDGWWVGTLRPLIAADASDATTNQLLSVLSGGEAGFKGAIDNLDSGPPWEWVAVFFRTFWVAGIEEHQPLGWFGLGIALLLCLSAAWGLLHHRSLVIGHSSLLAPQSAIRNPQSAIYTPQSAIPNPQSTIRNPQSAIHNPQSTIRNPQSPISNLQSPISNPQLLLSLLLLHLTLPLLLPLLRYAITFSLADTAQGRHLLFAAAAAFAILLVWGWSLVNPQSAIRNPQSAISNLHAKRPISNYLPFLPPIFLLLWTGVQLWLMTWAYHPLLPVQTTAAAERQVDESLNLALNDYVTLVGYRQQLEQEGQMLRLDLLWQATAVSPVDYLTEVRVVAAREQDEVQSQWLGYSANGRYPTRAWDVGDYVRDTVWLPLMDLKEGQYQVILNLKATNLTSPEQDPQQLSLTTLTLNQTTPANPDPQLWRQGKPLATSQTLEYRETILLTLPPGQTEQQRDVHIVGPLDTDHQQTFAPVQILNDEALFIVGPDWASGAYQPQITDSGQTTVGPTFTVIDRWQRQFAEPPMSQRIEANFANKVKLLGYDLGTNRAEAGRGIPLTVYWQALDWLGSDYTIFTKLLTADQSVHGGRERLPQEGYRTLYWAPGEIITDSFGVSVDVDAPHGIYYINIGLYEQVGEQAISLPLVQDGQPIQASSINIGLLKIGDTPPGLTLDQANPQTTLNQPFGDMPNLTLLGYDLTDENNQPISQLQTSNLQFPISNLQSPISNLYLTLYWRSEAALPLDYTTFVHIRNVAGENVAQKDQPPLNGAYPTSLWDPGEIIADEIVVPLPDSLPLGEYQIVIGLYDFQTGQRLTVPDNPANEVTLGKF